MNVSTDEKINTGCLVSVIVPVYNVKDYLRSALDSIICQTYTNLEIILVDDGSTDGCGEICDEYASRDDRIVVVHQENKGLSGARNTGLDIMHGDMVAYLDSDDELKPDYILEMFKAIRESSSDIVLCRFSYIDDHGCASEKHKGVVLPVAKQGEYTREDALRALAGGKINYSVWNKLYDSRLWDGLRFPDGHTYEDGDTIYRILDRCKKVYVIDKDLYLYRERSGSIVNTDSGENYKDRIRSHRHFNDYIRKNIPEIFDKKHLRIQNRRLLDFLFKLYFRLIDDKETDNTSFCNDIRENIGHFVKESGFMGCGLKSVCAYHMLRFSPGTLKVLYDVYVPFRDLYYNSKRKHKK